MGAQAPDPDDETIDAWLSGSLPPGEAEAVERFLEDTQHGVGLPQPGGDLLDLDLDRPATAPPGSPLAGLVESVRQLSSTAPVSPSSGSWREILAEPQEPGTIGQLGIYQVLGVIATGGMGIVFKARDPELHRDVAIKALAPELAGVASARARFIREARAAARLEHENILPIYAVHDAKGGVPYFAMRLAPGGSLQDVLDAGPAPDAPLAGIPTQLAIASGVAAALQAAHAAGIIHRDIKPANILLGSTPGQVWLADFGIARVADDPSLTYQGTIAGTPQYMSPEQAAGSPLDARSDLFSLGAVLYRCATGQHAVGGTTTIAVINNLNSPTPTPLDTTSDRSLPRWYANLIANLLAREPHHRPPDASAVLRAIRDRSSPLPKSRRRTRLKLAAAAALLTLAALAVTVPQARHLTSRLAAQVTGRPVLVSSRLLTYPDLRTAIAAAAPGDTITLPSGRITEIPNITIPPGKPLTLTGGATSHCTTRAGITSHSPITFRHLDISPTSTASPTTIVRLHAATATFEHCTITADSVAVLGPGLATLKFTDCRIAADVLARTTRAEGSPSQIVSLETDHLDFTGQHLFVHHPAAPIPDLTCKLAHSDLALDNSLAFIQTPDRPTALARLRIHTGPTSTFPAGNTFVEIGSPPTSAIADRVHALSDFDPSTGSYTGTGAPTGTVLIEPTGQRFADLATAAAAAPPGATLLLAGQFHIDTPISPRTPRLNLHAAPGTRPVITGGPVNGAPLFLHRPGSIRGIRFVQSHSDTGARLALAINSASGEVVIEDCEFATSPAGPQDSRNRKGLGITGGSVVTLRRCLFRTPSDTALIIDPRDRQLHLEDCLFLASTAIDYRHVNAPGRTSGTTDLHTTRCTFLGDRFLHFGGDNSTGSLVLHSQGCLFDLHLNLAHLSSMSPAELPTRLAWHGSDNVLPPDLELLAGRLIPGAAQPRTTLAKDFDALRQLGVTVESTGLSSARVFDHARLRAPLTPASLIHALSPDIATHPTTASLAALGATPHPPAPPPPPPPATSQAPGLIVLEETGESFTDFQTAFRSAPPGGTLLLSGRIEAAEEITPSRVVNLFAAPGQRPVVVGTDPMQHAIFLTDAAQIRGIRFERRGSTTGAMPVLGIKARGKNVVVEDCEFVSIPADATTAHHRGLSLTDVGTATIRRCIFRTPGGNGLIVCNSAPQNLPPAGSVINIDACLFTGASAIEQRSLIAAPTPISLNLVRCTLLTRHLLHRSPAYHFAPVHLHARDSLIDSASHLFELPDIDARTIAPLLRWRGNNNLHRAGTGILRTYRQRLKTQITPANIADFPALVELGVTAENHSLQSLDQIFDHSLLHVPLTPRSLRRALAPGITSPAVAALEILAETHSKIVQFSPPPE